MTQENEGNNIILAFGAVSLSGNSVYLQAQTATSLQNLCTTSLRFSLTDLMGTYLKLAPGHRQDQNQSKLKVGKVTSISFDSTVIRYCMRYVFMLSIYWFPDDLRMQRYANLGRRVLQPLGREPYPFFAPSLWESSSLDTSLVRTI